jgi:hypothetical protein
MLVNFPLYTVVRFTYYVRRFAVSWNTDDTDFTDLRCFSVHRLHGLAEIVLRSQFCVLR